MKRIVALCALLLTCGMSSAQAQQGQPIDIDGTRVVLLRPKGAPQASIFYCLAVRAILASHQTVV